MRLPDFAERLKGGHAHETLCRLHAERPVLGNPPGKLQGAIQGAIQGGARGRHHIDEAEIQCLGRRDGVRTVAAIVISSEWYRLVVITGCAAFAEPGKRISVRAGLVAVECRTCPS